MIRPKLASWFICNVLVALGFVLPNSASAMIVHYDGYATIRMLLMTDAEIIASMSASGKESEVIALDAKTGKVKWRDQINRGSGECETDGVGHLYICSGDILQKRDINTGRLLWTKALDKIPEQITPPERSLGEYFSELTDNIRSGSWSLPGPPGRTRTIPAFKALSTPNRYHYSIIPSGNNVTILREAQSGGGCTFISCFHDWTTLDGRSGQQTGGGSGALIAQIGSTTLIGNGKDHYRLQNGSLSALDLETSNHTWFKSSFRSVNDPASNNDQYCIFNDGAFSTNIFVFNAATKTVTSFAVPAEPNYQTGWVLLNNHLLRYSQTASYSDKPRANLRPWLELYDLSGKLLVRNDTTASKKPTVQSSHWYITFQAITGTGDVILSLSDYLLSIDIPTLETTISPHSAASDSANSWIHSFYPPRKVRVRYILHGNRHLTEMKATKVRHELSITAVDFKTGKILWKHTEPVVIQKVDGR